MGKRKEFNIQATAKVTVTVPIRAESLEDAVAQSRKMEIRDFVIPADGQTFDDCEHEVTGVFT